MFWPQRVFVRYITNYNEALAFWQLPHILQFGNYVICSQSCHKFCRAEMTSCAATLYDIELTSVFRESSCARWELSLCSFSSLSCNSFKRLSRCSEFSTQVMIKKFLSGHTHTYTHITQPLTITSV